MFFLREHDCQMPTQIEKIQAHSSHLLDTFIRLRERYALVEPLLFDEYVVQRWGSGRRARGFKILKNSLFLSCAQDIAKLTVDDDDRTPSLSNLIRALADDSLRAELKAQYASWKSPFVEEERDPLILEVIRQWELREKAERLEQFDVLYFEATHLWEKLSTSELIKGFRIIRDKVTAHTEVRWVVDKYQFVDVGALGIKWRDLHAVIGDMQRLVELLGLLIRCAGFAWEALDTQLEKAARDFWSNPSS